ncbi:MAG: diguanylate cyclase [Lentisphaeria bacterium]|nr:diguanylate cyclase [Lentisphaeria bacterium]
MHQIDVARTMIEPAFAETQSEKVLTRFLRGLGDHLSAPVMVMVWEGNTTFLEALNVTAGVSRETVDQALAEAVVSYEKEAGKKNDKKVVHVEAGIEAISATGGGGCFRGWPLKHGSRTTGYFLLAAEDEWMVNDSTVEFARHISDFFAAMYSMLAASRSAAVHDPLTGLYNRSYLEKQYLAMVRSCRRYHHRMAVIIVDIDYFKSVNDTYGHAAGDRVLVKFARILQATTRESDVLGRYGGDEFVILLPKGDEEDAVSCAERLRETVRKTVFCEGDHDLHVTLSMGIACGNPLSDEETDEAFPLLVKADTAIYDAKKHGRNRTHLWNADQLPNPVTQPSVGSTFKPIVHQQKEARLLLVDDEPSILSILAKGLRMEGYDCEAVADSQQALQKITATPYAYDLVITDIQMPGLDGPTLIKKIKTINESILTLAISGKATVETAVASLRHGAYDFIEKPVQLRHLYATVERALAYRSAVMENKRYQHHLSEMVRKKSAKLDETLEEVKQSYAFTLESLISLLDAREKDFGQHSKRVRDLSVLLARKMGVDNALIETIGQGALLHDIGKIAVPDHILLKKTTLTDDEWEIMRKHTETGFTILSSSTYLKDVADIVYSHHEYFNGEGYPRGLKEDKICLGARIFAVIDAYDAIRSTRTYKAARSAASALAEIEKGAGSQFDPRVVEVFKANHTEMEALFLELHE